LPWTPGRLKAAVEAVDKAQTDHKLAIANGSTDRFKRLVYAQLIHNNPFGLNTLGVSVSIRCASSTAIKAKNCARIGYRSQPKADGRRKLWSTAMSIRLRRRE